MAKKTEEIDSEFIARRPQDADITVPAVFDERRIKSDLQRLAATPSLFSKYVAVARSRFTKSTEIALLNQWTAVYQTATRAVQARTELDRAVHEHSQLHREYEIKDKEKDLRLAELDADIEEAKARGKRARYANNALDETMGHGRTQPYSTNDDLRRLEQWYIQQREAILSDHSMSVDEQDRKLRNLRAEYERRRGYVDM